jgi:hypothetical protein
MDLWAYTNQLRIDFNHRGKPRDNAIVKSLNGKLHDDCLNVHWFSPVERCQREYRCLAMGGVSADATLLTRAVPVRPSLCNAQRRPAR